VTDMISKTLPMAPGDDTGNGILPTQAQNIRLVLPDRLDLAAAEDLQENLLRVRGSDVALDGSGARHVGTSCIQVVLSALAEWRKDGFAFDIVDPSPQLSGAIADLGLVEHFDARAPS